MQLSSSTTNMHPPTAAGSRGRSRRGRGRGSGEEIEIPWRDIHAIGRGPPITLAQWGAGSQESLLAHCFAGDYGDENLPSGALLAPNSSQQI